MSWFEEAKAKREKDPIREMYETYITVDKVRIHLGRFKSLEEAGIKVRAAREFYHGEYANHG